MSREMRRILIGLSATFTIFAAVVKGSVWALNYRDFACGQPCADPGETYARDQKAPGHFAELPADSIAIGKPGHYKIFAVYDESEQPEVARSLKKDGIDAPWLHDHFASDVRVKTPAIDLEILP